MIILELKLYRGSTDKRSTQPVFVFAEKIQCMEPHDTGTRIQFHLNEPSLYVQESPDSIMSAINFLTQTQEEQDKCLKNKVIPFQE